MRKSFCLFLALGSCVVAPAPTSGNIQFDETTNLGFLCSSQALSNWTVSCRETNDSGTAPCETPVVFASYHGGQTYTFDITGYAGNGQLCWEGSCAVRAVGGTTLHPDCSPQIQRVCP
jgi:hypothetical protein